MAKGATSTKAVLSHFAWKVHLVAHPVGLTHGMRNEMKQAGRKEQFLRE